MQLFFLGLHLIVSVFMIHVVHGDILTQDFVQPNEIINAVNTQLKKFMGTLYKPSDFLQIIHLIDTDGTYIPHDSVVEENEEGKNYPYYTKTNIFTPNPSGIKDRNERKRQNLNRLISQNKIRTIPYKIFYFSSNLDHVLYNQLNLTDYEKTDLSIEFDLKYAEDPSGFISFMKDSDFAVRGDYKDSWDFIKKDLNSLNRYSNFCLFLEGILANTDEVLEDPEESQ